MESVVRFTVFIAPYKFMTIAPKIERNKRVAGSAIVGCDERSASHGVYGAWCGCGEERC